MTAASTRRDWLCKAAAAGLSLAGAARGEPSAPSMTAVQWPAMRLIDGSALAPEDLTGRPAIVVFWATWCAFCRRHNAHVDKLVRTLGSSGPRVLGVAMDGDRTEVQRYMQRNGYGFPVTLDEGRIRHRFTARRVVPMTCLVDRHGQLVQCIPGEMSESDVLDLPRAFTA